MIENLGSWTPNLALRREIEGTPELPTEGRYLYGPDQRIVSSQLEANYDTLVAMAIRGTGSKVIAAGFGVSREAIDRRLRPLGLKNKPGVRGRPSSFRLVSSQS